MNHMNGNNIFGMRAEVNKLSKTLDIYKEGQKPLQFPFLWLRDNCRCEKCFHPVSLGRLFLMRNLKADIQIADVKVSGFMFVNYSYLYISLRTHIIKAKFPSYKWN